MNRILFPGFNLEFNISRVALKIGGIQIYWYAIFIVLAFIIGILIFKRKDKMYDIKFSDILDLMIILIPISIISARAYYVLFRLDYYLKVPSEIFNLRSGGIAIYGGIIGGIITCYIYCKKKKISFIDLLDYIAPELALGQAVGRFGNFINVEAYGRETKNIFRMGIIENGKYIEVHPTFLYELISTLAIFIILTIMSKKRKFKGQIAYLYLIFYSFARAIIESLRTDSLMLGNFRISRSIINFNIYICKFYVFKKL